MRDAVQVKTNINLLNLRNQVNHYIHTSQARPGSTFMVKDIKFTSVFDGNAIVHSAMIHYAY